jgi:hypothetical protein
MGIHICGHCPGRLRHESRPFPESNSLGFTEFRMLSLDLHHSIAHRGEKVTLLRLFQRGFAKRVLLHKDGLANIGGALCFKRVFAQA